MNGGSLLLTYFCMAGNALTKISAISRPCKFPLVNTNALTRAFLKARNSNPRSLILLSLVSTTHPFLPTAGSHSLSLASVGKVIVMDCNASTGLTKDIRNDMFAKIPI